MHTAEWFQILIIYYKIRQSSTEPNHGNLTDNLGVILIKCYIPQNSKIGFSPSFAVLFRTRTFADEYYQFTEVQTSYSER